ncbi:MAG: hypothetical protein P8X50_07800 [Maritimibacter sp.]|jgi:hypothetical protein
MNSNTLSSRPTRLTRGLTIGTIAGLAGGAAEIGWIALYQGLTGHDAALVAKGVTVSVLPGLGEASSAVALGIVIHMVLALMIGLAFAIAIPRVLPRVAGTLAEPLLVVVGLVAIWAMNFFVLLPVINPDFVTIVPYGASLTSKVLFGLAAAITFRLASRKA